MPTEGLSQCLRNLLRMRQHETNVLPDQFIELLYGNCAGRTFLLTPRRSRQVSPIAHIVGIASTATTASTGQVTGSTTDQGA